PKHMLKLFRLARVRVPEGELVDHHFRVEGRIGNLRHDLIERNLKEDAIEFWVSKHLRYAGLHAREEQDRAAQRSGHSAITALWGTPDDRVDFLKRFWGRLPLYVRAVLYFLYRYVARLGFLDGKEGFLF